MTEAYTRAPVIHWPLPRYDDSLPGKSDITMEREKAAIENANVNRLATESEQLTDLIEQKNKEMSKIFDNQGFAFTQEMREKQAAIQAEIFTLQNKLSEVDDELREAQYLVNTRAQREKAEMEARAVAQTELNHHRARENVMVNDAIEQAERDRLHKSIEQYNALLEKYQKAAMWLNHKNSKTPIPDGLLDDQWRLTDHELENTRLIDEKKWNLQSRYGQHFHDLNSIVKEYNDYHESVAARKPRSKSPTPTSRDEATGVKIMNENRKLLPPSTMTPIGQLNFWWRRKGGRRSKKKGKKCTRRHSKKKSTRRH